ncbi:TIGR03086 family metal-binding protein [Rhodococcus sp. 06-235-1A]|uniref:TIGR03086 family metal-binding protein n=1 Tax=Rhodococcus sp. 06-235-1A TaxID=2022508 RepID=UPI001C5294DE|nr:TIGR03086 family metal-binding protein [Rhodococcus sp. 06-235-1A]
MTTIDTTQQTDPRNVYAVAAAWVSGLLEAVRPEQLDLPTPCDELDVRHLAGHLVSTVGRLIAIAELGSPDSVSPWSSVHDAGTFDGLVVQARAAWADDALLDAPVVVPWGAVPGRSAVWGYARELLLHGWDLAVATGQSADVDPALVHPVAEEFRTMLPAEARVPGVPFGPIVESRPEARPLERLANFSGRSSEGWV